MATASYNGHTVDVDGEGFMTDPEQWNREIAGAIADDLGISPLNDDHWKVIDFCRQDNAERGAVPGLRRIAKQTGVQMKTLYKLFPKGPGKLASKVAGLPKPKSCI